MASDAAWSALICGGVRVTHNAGERMLTQGTSGRDVIVLIGGAVKITYDAEDGTGALLAIRGPGDLLGEIAYGDSGARSATAWAMESCTACRYNADQFTEVVTQHRLREQLDRYRNAKIREGAELLWRASTRRVEARIAALLLNVMAVSVSGERPAHVIPMTQEDIAGCLGTGLRTVNLAFVGLKRMGLVRTGRGRVEVIQPRKLAQLARP
ncbi:MAG: Crp/Fnr family transcriptional regulator [Gammaproteobacteria bacterium]